MKVLDDGTIRGLIVASVVCKNCEKGTEVAVSVSSDTLRLPNGIKSDDQKIIFVKVKGNWLGITCGCYAKAHRQIAHIEDRLKQRQTKS